MRKLSWSSSPFGMIILINKQLFTPTPVDIINAEKNQPNRLTDRPAEHRSIWQRLIRETRTRILVLYALLLLMVSGASIPIFRYLLFENVDRRVTEDIAEEIETFEEAYAGWQSDSSRSIAELREFVDDFLRESRPEDDNFQIVLIDDELYRSTPYLLLAPLRPGSELFERWQDVTQMEVREERIADPDIGSILYAAEAILLDGEQRGVFVVAHSTAGERQEALSSVRLFSQLVVVVVLLSLLFAWLLAGRLLAPISSLSRTALSISESGLDKRIPPIEGRSELSDLVNTFNAMMDRIQTAFSTQRDFINDAGHELRTPITIIQGHLELMDGDAEERQETMELVMDELDRMGRLVSDMILLAKSKRPNFLQVETISVKTFAEELFAKATALADRRWRLVGDEAGTFVGDRQKLTGAILNLLRNAAQHTQPSDTVELGYRFSTSTLSSEKGAQQYRCVQIWVSDSGRGIAPDDQQRIFARFARGQHERRSEGSGLGLAIVKAIVETHDGLLAMSSQLGEGTRFCITLPITQAMLHRSPEAVAAPS